MAKSSRKEIKPDEPEPESDCLSGVPHPRAHGALFGHLPAQKAFLGAWDCGRLHHAWLISGPRGVGKATLAWRLAHFVLAQSKLDAPHGSADTTDTAASSARLAVDMSSPLMRHIGQLSEPRLLLLRRAWDEKKKRHFGFIRVDDLRKMQHFLSFSVPEGGHRVVVIDAAEDMNTAAANALLKFLEEPPKDTVFFLISHQPSALLPTIRSRCVQMRLGALSLEEMTDILTLSAPDLAQRDDLPALYALAGGSAGGAIALAQNNGLARYHEVVQLFDGQGRIARDKLWRLAQLGGVSGLSIEGRAQFLALCDTVQMFLSRLARTGLGSFTAAEACAGEAALMARLSPCPAASYEWAQLAQKINARLAHGLEVNLDAGTLILDMGLKIEKTARVWADKTAQSQQQG